MTKRVRFSDETAERLLNMCDAGYRSQYFMMDRFEELQLERDRLKAEDRMQLDQIQSLENDIEEKQTEIDDLRQQIRDKNVQIGQLDDEVHRLNNNECEQNIELDKLRTENTVFYIFYPLVSYFLEIAKTA